MTKIENLKHTLTLRFCFVHYSATIFCRKMISSFNHLLLKEQPPPRYGIITRNECKIWCRNLPMSIVLPGIVAVSVNQITLQLMSVYVIGSPTLRSFLVTFFCPRWCCECKIMQFETALTFPMLFETFPTLNNISSVQVLRTSKCNEDVQRLQIFT